MPGATNAARRDALAAGRAALRDGRWPEARRGFEAALAAGAGPDAHEGLSWAAWWLDDQTVVFAAREEAYRAYRGQGDARGAGRMATWLAVDALDFDGAAAVAAGWLRRAHRLLDGLDAAPEHGWLAFHEGYIAHARGDSDVARRLAAAAADSGRRFAVPDLEMLGLALEGAVLVASAQVEEGMRCLDEATATALEGQATIPISGAWACCFLVGACTAVLDFERAAAWCERIAAFAERYGSRYMLAFCRGEYGAVDLWRGRWTEAEGLLAASLEDFSASRPAWSGAPLVGLAELRRRQGRTQDALALLDRAGAQSGAVLCRARLALDSGEALRAADLAERLLRQLPRQRRLARVPALQVLIEARVARGELEQAAAALVDLREAERLAGTVALRACADRAEGMLVAAAGEHERARVLLEDAVDGFEQSGAPFDVARARVELAVTLGALRRADGARREAAAALASLRALGAEGEARRASTLLDGAAALRPPAAAARVTRREADVLRLLAQGLTNRQIAARLVVSEHTVHRHVTNILRKLGLHSRTAAAAYAVRSGLGEVDPGR